MQSKKQELEATVLQIRKKSTNSTTTTEHPNVESVGDACTGHTAAMPCESLRCCASILSAMPLLKGAANPSTVVKYK